MSFATQHMAVIQEPKRTLRYARITGLAGGQGELRTASMAGIQYTVVPVIMLVGNSVVRPMGSRGPEFVPASELAYAVGGWNGRPILPDHPDNGNASANEPGTLERYCFGYVFNTRFEDGKLKAEAWLDSARAALVGSDAQSVITRCLAGEMVEVSVGAWVDMEERSGIYNGQHYEFVWHSAVPDHLAMLPEGVPGACSVEMGCGAPRSYRAALPNSDEGDLMNLRNLLRQIFTANETFAASVQEKGYSDAELRQTLDQLLFSSVPAFMGVSAVYPDSKTVIYMTSSQDGGYQYWRRSYKAYGDSFKLADDAEEVVQEVVYTPASASKKDEITVKIKVDTTEAVKEIETATAAVAELKAACGCKDQNGDGQTSQHSADEATAAPANVTKEASMADQSVKDAVGRLLAHKRSPWKGEHREFLESLGADHLKQLEEALPAEVDASAATTETAAVETEAEKTEEEKEREFLATAPESLKRFIAAAKQREQDERREMIVSLVKNQKVYSEAQLKAKSTDDLVGMTKLLGLDAKPSFVGAAGFVTAEADVDGDDIYRNPPDPWGVNKAKSA